MKTKTLSTVTILILMCFTALSLNAQRCAVLEFKAGAGISQSDVDGISAIFITYFRPAGYTMVERTQIDRIIDEQGFQRSNMTESQMVRIGKILNVSKIVVDDVNVVMGQYNVDARVINVETGTIAATEGATFASSSYRSSMQNVATKLASKIAITSGGTVQAQTGYTNTPKQRTTVETLYGYLKIFPNELGTFQSEPTAVIAQINKQAQHGYNNWRIPTNEELSLLRANNYLGSGTYMSRENRNGIVLLVTDGDKYAAAQTAGQTRITVEQKAQGWVDLGLPSGTLWKDKNEAGGFFTYYQAIAKFGNSLPTKEQCEELKNYCQWTWYGNGYRVTGPSGESIIMPADGYNICYGGVADVGAYGGYWSSEQYGSDYATYLRCVSGSVSMTNCARCNGLSVRLVHN